MLRVGAQWSIRTGHRAGTGNLLRGTLLHKAILLITTLGTILGGGPWVTTGSRRTEDYRRKTGVVLWMTEREGGETVGVNHHRHHRHRSSSNNGSYLTLVGTVGLSRTGKLFHTWRSLGSMNKSGTGNLPLAGNRTNTAVRIINTGTSAINNGRETATPTSLVTSGITTTTIAGIGRAKRARSGKIRISSEESGSSSNSNSNNSSSSRMTKTLTSSSHALFSFNASLNLWKFYSWTRRDTSQVSGVNQIPLKRRQQRSRSRSGSPTNSFYSRRSSHGGRSRSRSPSPKRLRHSVSPSRHDSSPVNKRQKWKKNRHGDNQQNRDRGRARRRSPSPVGSISSRSVSSASSRSSGAGDRPRTLHRLPTATNVRDIDITLSMSKTTAAWDHSPKNTRRGRDQSTSPKVDVSSQPWNNFTRFPDHKPHSSGRTSDLCLNPIQNSILAPICLHLPFHELSTNLVPRVLSNWQCQHLRRGRKLVSDLSVLRAPHCANSSPLTTMKSQCSNHETKQ